jgi:hypothetical protein
MDFEKLLLLQFIGHVLTDYFFQSDLWARHKRRFGFYSKVLYWHVLIVFIISYILSFQWNFILASLAISVIHLLIDGLKEKIGRIKVGRKKTLRKLTFLIDQLLHLVTIYVAVFLFTKYFTLDPVFKINLSNHQLLIILGYLLCLKPSNILIRNVFVFYNLRIENNPKEDLLNAGKLIGNIERILTLSFLLIGQYEAIGFLIAGKSILRYEGVKTSKTEYVLIGTLLSFVIAILIRITINILYK